MELQGVQEEKASDMSHFPWEAPAIRGTMGFCFTATQRGRWTMREQQRVEPRRRARLVALKTGNL